MVVWKKESVLISAGNTKVIRDNRLNIVGTSLDINKVSSKDSGNYTCEINTDVPSHINIVLNVLGELKRIHHMQITHLIFVLFPWSNLC